MKSNITVTPDDLQKCLDYPTEIIETEYGPVEYGDHGKGPAILSVHGGPGGYDQGLGMADMFRKAGFRIIAPSRPGYLNTPLDSGRSMEEQADLLAFFLDALGLSEVVVLGVSAGGFSTYQLAQRHPSRVSSLIEIDSVSTHYTKVQEISPLQEKIYLSKPGMAIATFFADRFPRPVVKNILSTESSLKDGDLKKRLTEIMEDRNKTAFVNFMVKTMSYKYDQRKAGLQNDIEVLEALDEIPLSNIVCPTLIVHGTADTDVPLSHARYAAESISGSDYYPIESGSHLGFWTARGAYEAQSFVVSWLNRHI